MTRIHESQRVPILRAALPPKDAAPEEKSKGGDQLLLAEKAQGHTFFGIAYLNRRWNEAKAAYGIAESGWKEFQAAQKSGDYTRFYANKVDPFLDGTALGPDDEYQDAGALAPILTNRMAIGETVSLSIGAGATFPLEEFGIPNAKLDGGSTVKLTRVQKQDRDGNPLSEPKDEQGKPPSELIATFELEGKAGGSYSAKAGFTLGGTMGRYTAGMQATVGAEAEAGIDGKVQYTFAFDPASAKDMTALTDLLKRTAAEQTLPLSKKKEFTKTMSSHLRSIGGEGGLYAQAVGSARANFGIFRNGPDPEAETLKDKTKGLMHKFLAELRKGQLAGGGSIEAHFGATRNLRSGDRTVYATLDGTAGINGRLPLYNLVNEEIKGKRTVAFTYGKDEKLKEVLISDEVAKDQFSKGLRGNIEDLMGRPFGQGGIAQLAEADAVRIRYHLKPEDWETLSASDLLKPNKAHFSSVEVKTVHRASVEFKASVELELGAQIGVRGQIVGTHEAEKTAD